MIPPTDFAAVDQIIAALKENRTFCLSGHQNPDADVVGSQLAMASLIKRIGKNTIVDICNAGHPPKNLSYLSGYDHVKSVDRVEGQYDVLIVFECSGADRMGGIIDFSTQVKTVINIDHHLHNPNFGHINWVEPSTSSTAELIFKIFDRAKIELTRNEAISLYTGLVADTGCFRYGNTNVQTHMIGARLLEKGVPVADVSERIYMNKSLPAVRLLTGVMSQMKLLHNNRLAVLRLTEELFRSVDATADDTDEIVNAGLQVGSVVASVLIKEKTSPPLVKVSFRSKGDFDINQVARKFGGGGHKNASGCTLNLSIDDAEKAILKEMAPLFAE